MSVQDADAPGGAKDGKGAQELDDFLAEAEQMVKESRYDDAEIHLLAVIERYPDSPLPHHDLAVVYLARLREDYEHLEIWEDLADDEEVFELAVAETEAALDLDENFLPARNNLGTLFALRAWWEPAIQQWEMSLSVNPDQPVVREDLARARSRLG